jgi:hypothetical protein
MVGVGTTQRPIAADLGEAGLFGPRKHVVGFAVRQP